MLGSFCNFYFWTQSWSTSYLFNLDPWFCRYKKNVRMLNLGLFWFQHCYLHRRVGLDKPHEVDPWLWLRLNQVGVETWILPAGSSICSKLCWKFYIISKVHIFIICSLHEDQTDMTALRNCVEQMRSFYIKILNRTNLISSVVQDNVYSKCVTRTLIIGSLTNPLETTWALLENWRIQLVCQL
jgi:hypothetical protein